MDNEYGIKLALSPVQMAAVLSDKSISEGETLSNRLFGGLGLAGGVTEMFGAGVMCVVPEPTMLTKAGCVFVGTHGLDTIQASVRQIWSGRQTNTDTYNSAVALAESLGADKSTAMNVGMTVDLAIPMGFSLAVGAQRIAAIRSGRIRIAEHESLTGKKPGGHTLEKHIGKTPEQLRARFDREPRLYESGCFRTQQEAEQLISTVLRDNKNQIEMWVRNMPPGLSARMTLHRTFYKSTGILVKKESQEVFKCYGIRVVLQFQSWNGKPYFVLTAFPEI